MATSADTTRIGRCLVVVRDHLNQAHQRPPGRAQPRAGWIGPREIHVGPIDDLQACRSSRRWVSIGPAPR